MAHKVIWSPRALAALEEIVAYIEKDSPANAAAVAQRVVAAADRLADFPGMGRVVPEFDRENIREVIVFRFRLIYRVRQYYVDLVDIIHGARDLRRALEERDLPS
jgi:toxin ParE1/3/4